jgi:GT2 family glycosyltransferase
MYEIAVVIPNWNGVDTLGDCLDSLYEQSLSCHVIVVDNASTDNSLELLKKYPQVEVIKQSKNMGYTGGVNPGFQIAIERNLDFVATVNNDATVDKYWLKHLVEQISTRKELGAVTSKILSADGHFLDSTGDFYTVWGLSYPRGRGEKDLNKYDNETNVFGASGGASLYRVNMLKEVGLFDDDFFAYYEDADLSFRIQLAGWKIAFAPEAIVYHQIGATSGKIKGFTTYQTLKNQPLLFFKNVPLRYFFKIGIRLTLAQMLFFLRAFSRGQFNAAFKGVCQGIYLIIFKTPSKRRRIMKTKKVSDEYIWSLVIKDLPPDAVSLKSIRSYWRRLIRKKDENSN